MTPHSSKIWSLKYVQNDIKFLRMAFPHICESLKGVVLKDFTGVLDVSLKTAHYMKKLHVPNNCPKNSSYFHSTRKRLSTYFLDFILNR